MTNDPFSFNLDQLKALKPCPSSWTRIEGLLTATALTQWNAKEAREAGCTFLDIRWVASRIAYENPIIARRYRHWMADCAASILPYFEEKEPNDSRPRMAIEAARSYADGKLSDALLTEARDAARLAALEAEDKKYEDIVIRAAVLTILAAYPRHLWGIVYPKFEEDWRFDRLIAWLSPGKEPEPIEYETR